MNEAPHVSVIVPFVETEPYLGACVEALLAQDGIGGPVEIIVVDNGSSDGGAAVIDRHPELVVVRETRPGVYAARNAGIRRARAPLIAFTDADCVVAADWVRAVSEGMCDPGVAILVGACEYPADASLGLGLLAAYENAKADYVIQHCPSACHFAYANNMAVRASVFADVGPFREWARAADTELVHRVASSRPDLRLAFTPSMRVTHREFVRTRARLRRLSLYTETNSRIPTFRELRAIERAGVLLHLVRRGLSRVRTT